MQSLWLVSRDGCPIRLFCHRSSAVSAVALALRLRALSTRLVDIYRSALQQRGEVITSCGVWRVESVPVVDNFED